MKKKIGFFNCDFSNTIRVGLVLGVGFSLQAAPTVVDSIVTTDPAAVNQLTGSLKQGVNTTVSGQNSVAAGKNVDVTHNNSFVWNDGTYAADLNNDGVTDTFTLSSTTNGEFIINASAGIYLLGGPIEGDASNMFNIPADKITGVIPAQRLPTSGTWNAGGMTIQNANFSNVQIDPATVSIPAAGVPGSLQFNNEGEFAGCENFFVQESTGKVAFRAENGDIFRVFKEDNSGEELIYRLRRYEDTAEISLWKNGIETIRLRGDGTIYAANGIRFLGGPISGDGSGLTNLNVSGTQSASWGSIAGSLTNQSDLSVALANKANHADVTTALATKANTNDVSVALASKANAADVTTALGAKANATDVSAALATKADAADVTTALTAKVNTSALGTMAYAATTNYVSTAQFAAGNSNYVNQTQFLTAVTNGQSNVVFKGRFVTGSGAASGNNAVAMGMSTTAGGAASFAAGSNAKATNDYSYVWSDGMNISSTTTKQYTVYATNGIRLLGGPISGDGALLTNLNASKITGTIPVEKIPVSEMNLYTKDVVDQKISDMMVDFTNIGGPYGDIPMFTNN